MNNKIGGISPAVDYVLLKEPLTDSSKIIILIIFFTSFRGVFTRQTNCRVFL